MAEARVSIVKGQLQDVPYSSELTRSAPALSHKQDPIQFSGRRSWGAEGGVNSAPRVMRSRNLFFFFLIGEHVRSHRLQRVYFR